METSFEMLVLFISNRGITTSGRKYARLFSFKCFSQNKLDFNFYSTVKKFIHSAIYRNLVGGIFMEKTFVKWKLPYHKSHNDYGNNNKYNL